MPDVWGPVGAIGGREVGRRENRARIESPSVIRVIIVVYYWRVLVYFVKNYLKKYLKRLTLLVFNIISTKHIMAREIYFDYYNILYILRIRNMYLDYISLSEME